MPTAEFVVAHTSDAIYKTADGDINYLHGTKEEANFRELRAIIMQAGNLANYATSVFQDIYNDIVTVGERVSVIDQRLSTNVFSGHLPYIEHQFVIQGARPHAFAAPAQCCHRRARTCTCPPRRDAHRSPPLADEPMQYFDNPRVPVDEIRGEWSQRTDNLFTNETLPPGLVERATVGRATLLTPSPLSD